MTRRMLMRYRIEYRDKHYCVYADSRNELLERLKQTDSGGITDIRKVYKNRITEEVMEKYSRYLPSVRSRTAGGGNEDHEMGIAYHSDAIHNSRVHDRIIRKILYGNFCSHLSSAVWHTAPDCDAELWLWGEGWMGMCLDGTVRFPVLSSALPCRCGCDGNLSD